MLSSNPLEAAPFEGMLLCPSSSHAPAIYRLSPSNLIRRAGANEEGRVPLRGAAVVLNDKGTTTHIHTMGDDKVTLDESFDVHLPCGRAFRFFASSILCRKQEVPIGIDLGGQVSLPMERQSVALPYVSAADWVSAISYVVLRSTFPLDVPHDSLSAPVDGSRLGPNAPQDPREVTGIPLQQLAPTTRIVGFRPSRERPQAAATSQLRSAVGTQEDHNGNVGMVAMTDPHGALLLPVLRNHPDINSIDVPPRIADKEQFGTLVLGTIR